MPIQYRKNHFRFIKDVLLGLNLRTKWMLWTLIFVISFSIILVSFFIENGKKNLELELEKWGTSLATNLAYSAQYAALVKDHETLQNYLIGIMNEKEILYAAVLDDSGAILAIVDPKWKFTTSIHDLSMKAPDGKIDRFDSPEEGGYCNIVKFMEIEKEELIEDERILFERMEKIIEESGELHFKLRAPSRSRKTVKIILGVTLKNMNEKLIKMRDNAISIAVIIALFCISAVFIGVQQMTAPIKQLVAAMKKVSSGDLSHFVENHRKDELGFLADSFNEMIDKLKLSQEEIKNYTQILEKRVSDRTRELRESEEKYRTLFEHSGTAVTLIENNKRLLMVNKGFEMLSGYPKAEIEGKFTLSNFLIKDDRAKIKEYYLGRKTGSESGVPRNYECIFVDRYGRHRDVNLTMSTIPGTRYFLASLTDVSELKQLQKRLMRSEQLAAIGELSASIAHEIRNPLGAINTSVGILKGTLNLDRQDQELMEIICEEAMRLKRITDDFLQFAFPKTPDFRHKNINILLQEIMILMKHKLEGCIQTEMALDPTLPMVPVDVNQLKQVILNVLVNGIDSMNGSGKLTLATRCTRDANQEPQAVIELSDTGCGIKESEYYKIFQPFYSTKEKGAGMGLAICERIIQNHGGEIKVESAVGKGTKFTILLPLKV